MSTPPEYRTQAGQGSAEFYPRPQTGFAPDRSLQIDLAYFGPPTPDHPADGRPVVVTAADRRALGGQWWQTEDSSTATFSSLTNEYFCLWYSEK